MTGAGGYGEGTAAWHWASVEIPQQTGAVLWPCVLLPSSFLLGVELDSCSLRSGEKRYGTRTFQIPWKTGQLVEENYQVGVTTVRDYLREKRRQKAEVYVPLVHRPGEEGQVDFFEVTVEESGELRKA